MSDGAGKFERLVDGGIENLVRSFFDEYEKENAEFRANAGLPMEVIREEVGDCCDWCADLADTYDYWDAPKEVWQRHEHCRCMVIVRTTKGTFQDAWSKKEYQSQREARIAREEELANELTSERARKTAQSEGKKYVYGEALPVDMDYIESKEYSMKYQGITGDPEVDDIICEQAKSILKHRSGTDGEDLILIDYNTGEILLDHRTSKEHNGVEYTNEIEEKIIEYSLNGRKIVALHNHPPGTPPTAHDAVSALFHGYDIGVACGHNGRVFTYLPAKYPMTKEECNKIHNYIALQEVGLNGRSLNGKTIDERWSEELNRYGVYFRGRD